MEMAPPVGMSHLRIFSIVLLVSVPMTASAQPGTVVLMEMPAQPTGESTVKRYGTTIALVDAASLLSGALTPYISMGGYLFGGPIVHLKYGNNAQAATSLGLRVGLPIVGGLVGMELENCSSGGGSLCGLGGLVLGAMSGMATALIVDWFVLAKKIRHKAPVSPGIRVGGVVLLPDLAISKNGDTSLFLRGTF